MGNSYATGDVPVNTRQLISAQTLAAPAASIAFSSIPATFNHLELIAVAASSAVAEGDYWQVRLNGDGGSNYDNEGISIINTTVSGSATTDDAFSRFGTTANDMAAASATAGSTGLLRLLIPLYAGTTFRKIVRLETGYNDAQTAAADKAMVVTNGLWRSTAAVTSITLTPATGPNFITGSAAWLYGKL